MWKLGFLGFLGLLTGCSLTDGGDGQIARSNHGRLVIRESIDSIAPGFTPTMVRGILGDPAAIGIGDYAGFNYEYGAGSGTEMPPEMEILFAEDYGDQVADITVNKPYPGRTKEGIGLGFPKEIVRQFIGQPDLDLVRTSWMRLGEKVFRGDAYLRGDTIAMVLRYDSVSTVDRIDLIRIKF